MRYNLSVSFIIDDENDDAAELVEDIRREVAEIVSEYSDTYKPSIKIWEDMP